MNIFIFRRDLRLKDNTSLIKLIKDSNGENIYLIFIYNEFQISKKNEYFSNKAFHFLNESLKNLSKKVKLNFFFSKEDTLVLKEIHQKNKIKRLYTNQDFTDYAIQRDNKIKLFCKENKIIYKNFNDYILFNPKNLLTKKQSYFKVFKPFYELFKQKIKKEKIKIKEIDENIIFQEMEKNKYSYKIIQNKEKINIPITKKEVFQIISKMQNYNLTHNFLWKENSTSKISAAIKFGIVSYKEILIFAIKKLGIESEYVRQLIWKEFFYHYYLHNKKTYKLRGIKPTNINKRYDYWEYDENEEMFEKWKKGETGIDIIDACMIELNTTGFMHNRGRMIVSSFLSKDLNIDWRKGEKYFAKKLIDYDPIINNQLWQWSAGSGLDYQGGWRIFAAEIQEKKYDGEKIYIRKYLKEQKFVPIVNLKETRKKYKIRYKNFQEKWIKNNYL